MHRYVQQLYIPLWDTDRLDRRERGESGRVRYTEAANALF